MKHRRDPTPKLWEDPVAVRAHAFCATAATPRFDMHCTEQTTPNSRVAGSLRLLLTGRDLLQ